MNAQQQHQPMQEVYPTTGISVQDQPDGGRLLIIQVPLPRKNIIIPMSVEGAKEVGAKLMAPSVQRAASNGSGGGSIVLPPGGLAG